MQHIHNVASQALKSFQRAYEAPLTRSTQASQQTPPPPTSPWIDYLFARLSSIYGYLWSGQHHCEQEWKLKKISWSRGLANLSKNQLGFALDACSRITKIPTLPEFIELALQAPVPAALQQEKLELPRAPREVISKHCEEFRQILRMANG